MAGWGFEVGSKGQKVGDPGKHSRGAKDTKSKKINEDVKWVEVYF